MFSPDSDGDQEQRGRPLPVRKSIFSDDESEAQGLGPAASLATTPEAAAKSELSLLERKQASAKHAREARRAKLASKPIGPIASWDDNEKHEQQVDRSDPQSKDAPCVAI